MMAESLGSVQCSVSTETFSSVQSNNTVKKSHKNAHLEIGRNEFRDVVLKMTIGSISKKFDLKNVNVHRRFMKDGKATLSFKDQGINLLISNCPPNSLLLFLRTLVTKMKSSETTEKKVTIKKRLLADRRRNFQEISPITEKDLKAISSQPVNEKSCNLKNVRCNILNEGKRASLKRQIESEKENIVPSKQNCKASIDVSKLQNAVKLTPDQERAIRCVQSGSNVFFTGKAGTGKSYLLRKIVGTLPPDKTFVTASTGAAACQIGGITLHSFAGIGSGKSSLEHCIQLATRKSVIKQWKSCEHLIIDEISMVDADLFSKLENIARITRNSEAPFGGIQLILCGDFLQLPPVNKENVTKFCFQTSAWDRCIHISIILNHVKRQTDQKFIKILHEIRLGSCSEEVEQILKMTRKNVIDNGGIKATRLCTHKEDVNYTNEMHLEKLPGEAKIYYAFDSDCSLSSFMDKNGPVTRELRLKKGTQVMLVKNLDVRLGLVNGSRGVVVGFDSSSEALPMVKFLNRNTMTIRYEKFPVKSSNGMFITRKQLPLKLAWAISIHKSQGMTLDCVEMSLSKVFECGQAYVALSRARSLDGLRILDFNKECVRANPNVLKFYSKLKILHDSRPPLQTMN